MITINLAKMVSDELNRFDSWENSDLSEIEDLIDLANTIDAEITLRDMMRNLELDTGSLNDRIHAQCAHFADRFRELKSR